MTAYYNEIDPFAAQWLRNLIAAGHIAPGDVDERSIKDVKADDLKKYTQAHFFAGIGVWSHALRLAGWDDDRPVWTGSCPCQPFSAAGKRQGTADDRHLWPAWFDLIRQCRPAILFGEQVASSEVVGHSKPGLQGLPDRQAVHRVLRELKGSNPRDMQGVRPGQRASAETSKTPKGVASVQGVARQKQGLCTCECRAVPGETTEHTLRFGPKGNSSEDRRGGVRVDGNTVRPQDPPRMERPLFGPDSASRRVHNGEHAGGFVCAECYGQHLGAGPYIGDCQGDQRYAGEELERLVESLGRKTSPTPGPVWIDAVFNDLERAHYACGAVDIPAASVGAPHIRQRLWFVALSESEQHDRCGDAGRRRRQFADGGVLGHAEGERRERGPDDGNGGRRQQSLGCPSAGGLADTNMPGYYERAPSGEQPLRDGRSLQSIVADAVQSGRAEGRSQSGSGPAAGGFWSRAKWLHCTDGKARLVEPGVFPLAHGATQRMGRLRAYGNAICPQVAKAFIEVAMEYAP